jgi:hypothetical protein
LLIDHLVPGQVALGALLMAFVVFVLRINT